MPTWGEILDEVRAAGDDPDLDEIRDKYIGQLHSLTGRPVVVYATDWLSGKAGGNLTAIGLEDMQGMMEVCKDVPGPNLDLILHSPGGSAESTQSIVRYLRKKFDHIRVFVPLAAMSAATMLALSADEIFMGKHSQLGPIDPQFVFASGMHPARAILDQWQQAKDEIKEDASTLAAWMPILQQYGPSLLKQAEQAEALAKRLVEEWSREYMLRDDKDGPTKAKAIADYFGDYRRNQSHSIGIDRDEAAAVGVIVRRLEDDQALQDAVLSVHHAVLITFATRAVKIIENHLGRRFVKMLAG